MERRSSGYPLGEPRCLEIGKTDGFEHLAGGDATGHRGRDSAGGTCAVVNRYVCSLTISEQNLCLCVDPKGEIEFGERFYTYARRVQSMSLLRGFIDNTDTITLVEPTIILAWANNLSTRKLFPRLRTIVGYDPYCRHALKMQAVLKLLNPRVCELDVDCTPDFSPDADDHVGLRQEAAGIKQLWIKADLE
jgi:hypothetical protein